MVYIRKKKVKGIDYAYIVRSVWDQTNRTSRQETIKYLGKASALTEEMIPMEYRNDPSIISFITRYSRIDRKKNELMIKKLCQDLFKMLSSGDLQGVIRLYDNYKNLFGTAQFYDNVLKPTMYDIGQLWAEQKIDVATEHVSANTANALIKIINERHLKSLSVQRVKGKVFICTPSGEQHNLACNIIESILLSKGYKVYNASPSLPADSMINSLSEIMPDVVLISVTLLEHVQTAQNLIKKIRTRFPILPIIVGGIALNDMSGAFSFDGSNTSVIRNITLIDTVKLIKSVLTLPSR